ncbi:MAG: undecaprenyl-diphosphate phosphatase [Spirochaetales bacterium]|nr:undecaprenyl-diphosphate phosphatase [Spirochaetales bacterium]
MTLLQGIILGISQGIAEFLPVSSSGHLVVLRQVMGLGDVPKLFDILLHIATLFVVIYVYRVKVLRLLRALWKFITRNTSEEDGADLRMILFVLISTFITGVIGVSFESLGLIENITVTSLAFIGTGLLLLSTLFLKPTRGYEQLKWTDSVIVGFAQGIGTIPGVSRSGSTISAAMLGGMDRETAGEYSFIISIPAILGALVLDMGEAGDLFSQVSLDVIVVSFLVTVVSGYFALSLLIKLLQKGTFYFFSFYLIPLGLLSFIFLR